MATFKTRICNKYDEYQNWLDSKIVPLKGEICIVTLPAGEDESGIQQKPAVLIKVGDGETEFSQLPWLSGKAADVYDWAKAENKPVYEAKEITGIDTYIADYVQEEMGISVDTDTQYTIVPVDGKPYQFKLMSKSKLDEEFTTEVASFEMPEFDHTEMDEAIKANADAIDVLNGDAETAGSVAKAIADAIVALKLDETYDALGAAKAVQGETESTVKAVEDDLKAYKQSNDAKIGAVEEGKTIVGLIEAAQAAAEAAQNIANAKVATVAAGDASVTIGGTATEPTVAVKLSAAEGNAIVLAEDGLKVEIPVAAEYSVVKDENSGDFAAVYHLTKDGVNVGASINIPKDMVVQSGAVIELADGDIEGFAAGTYIELTLQNVEDPLYINVGDLIEYVTGGTAADGMITVSVSEDHVATATINDGTVTLAKMAQDVKDAIADAKQAGIDAGTTAAENLKSAKEELEGKITDLDDSLKTVAKSGDIADLTQVENTYVTFECGSATEVI